jgi:hypothetical protein
MVGETGRKKLKVKLAFMPNAYATPVTSTRDLLRLTLRAVAEASVIDELSQPDEALRNQLLSISRGHTERRKEDLISQGEAPREKSLRQQAGRN